MAVEKAAYFIAASTPFSLCSLFVPWFRFSVYF
jgi:hypothetical protein